MLDARFIFKKGTSGENSFIFNGGIWCTSKHFFKK